MFLVTKIKLNVKKIMDINESVQGGNLHKKYGGNNNFDSGNAVGESVALLYKDQDFLI